MSFPLCDFFVANEVCQKSSEYADGEEVAFGAHNMHSGRERSTLIGKEDAQGQAKQPPQATLQLLNQVHAHDAEDGPRERALQHVLRPVGNAPLYAHCVPPSLWSERVPWLHAVSV